jgi:hypothetical protein
MGGVMHRAACPHWKRVEAVEAKHKVGGETISIGIVHLK